MKKSYKPKFEGRLRLKRGDEVVVLAGKDKGRRGKVIETIPDEGRVIVDGVNVVTKHQKPRRATRATPKSQTGLIHAPAPMSASKVMLVCPKCSKPTRLTTGTTTDGTRTRRCPKCGELLDV
ncbi:MAG: 50S ribosomal protein L24 [Armatimonadetes bacterium]|nr:50S ribosomal protein L24 [Armatimonadota bacterium]